MIEIPQFPSYFRDETIEKQLDAIFQYLNTLKVEMNAQLNDIHLDSLDSSLREKLASISNTLTALGRSINVTQELLASNYAKVSEIQANGIKVGEHTYTEKTATIDGQTIHYLGYTE